MTATDITNESGATITNTGTIESDNAISNAGSISSNADNMKAEINNSGEYNITGGSVSYKVTGNNGTVNIRNDEVTVKTTVEGNNVNLATTLKLEEENYLDGSTLTIENGATLDLQNDKVGTVGAPITITEANWNLKLDIDLESSTADMLTISEVDANSIATINGIKLLSDKTSETLVQIANVDINN